MSKPESSLSNRKLKHMIRNVSHEVLPSAENRENHVKGITTPSKSTSITKKRNQSVHSQSKHNRNTSSREAIPAQNTTNDVSDANFLNSTLNHTLFLEQSVPHVLNEMQQSIGVLKKLYQDLSKKRKSSKTASHSHCENLNSHDDYRSPTTARRPKIDIETLQHEYEKAHNRKTHDIQTLYDFYLTEFLDKPKSTSILKSPEKTRPNSCAVTANYTSRNPRNDTRMCILPPELDTEPDGYVLHPPPNTRRPSPVDKQTENFARNVKRNTDSSPKEKRSSSAKVNSAVIKKMQHEGIDNTRKRQSHNETSPGLVENRTPTKSRSKSPGSKRKSATGVANVIGGKNGSPERTEKQDEEVMRDNEYSEYLMNVSKALRQKYLPSKQPKKFKKTSSLSFSGKKVIGDKAKDVEKDEQEKVGDQCEGEKEGSMFSKIFEKNMLINKLKQHINDNLQLINAKDADITSQNMQEVKVTLSQLQKAQAQKNQGVMGKESAFDRFTQAFENFSQHGALKSSRKQPIVSARQRSTKKGNAVYSDLITGRQKTPIENEKDIVLNSYDLKMIEDLSKMADMITKGSLPEIESDDSCTKSFEKLRKKLATNQKEKTQDNNKNYILEVQVLDQNNKPVDSSEQNQIRQQTLSDLESILDHSASLVTPHKYADKDAEFLHGQQHFLDTFIDEGEFLRDLQNRSGSKPESIDYSEELDQLQYQLLMTKFGKE